MITKGEWTQEEDNLGCKNIVAGKQEIFCVNGRKNIYYNAEIGFTTGLTDESEDLANARLIVAAVNGCQAVNPANPMAVAKSIKEMYEALKALIANGICDFCYEDECGGDDTCTLGKDGEPCPCHIAESEAWGLAHKALAKAEGRLT